jgi:hypothetical protein
MNTPLATQQAGLLAALWQPRLADAMEKIAGHAVLARPAGPFAIERAVQAYRSNGLLLAERAMAAAYPAVAFLLGDDNFNGLARQHWLQHPPRAGDVAQWGGGLAAHLATLDGLVADQPWLPDVARVEWALHRAAFAADAQVDAASFALLAEHPDTAGLRLAPGWACIDSRCAVATITRAAHEGQAAGFDAPAGTALVWREGLAPRLRAALPGEPELLTALDRGLPLAAALETSPQLNLQDWLALAVPTGLVIAACLASNPEERTP